VEAVKGGKKTKKLPWLDLLVSEKPYRRNRYEKLDQAMTNAKERRGKKTRLTTSQKNSRLVWTKKRAYPSCVVKEKEKDVKKRRGVASWATVRTVQKREDFSWRRKDETGGRRGSGR